MTNHSKQMLNKNAQRLAQFACDSLFEKHRGRIPIAEDISFYFGNDGFQTDERSKATAETVKQTAKERGCRTSDIQTDIEGITWGLAVACDEDNGRDLEFIMYSTWFEESEKRPAAMQAKQEKYNEEIKNKGN